MGERKSQTRSLSYQPFQDLKKKICSSTEDPSSKPDLPSMKLPISDNDLFCQAMSQVREIEEFRKLPIRRTKFRPVCKKNSDEVNVLKTLEDIVLHRTPLRLSHTQEYVQWVNEDFLREDIATKLHEGRYAVQDCLDLHGFTVDEAKVEIELFFRNTLRRRLRCIKIIHGRGLRSPDGPVLKKAVIQWLSGRFRKYILSFVTARPCDGGLGALYVLLR